MPYITANSPSQELSRLASPNGSTSSLASSIQQGGRNVSVLEEHRQPLLFIPKPTTLSTSGLVPQDFRSVSPKSDLSPLEVTSMMGSPKFHRLSTGDVPESELPTPYSNQPSRSVWKRIGRLFGYYIPEPIRAVLADNQGLLLIGAAQFFSSLMNCLVKVMSSREDEAEDADRVRVPTVELIACRMFITGICAVTWMWFSGVPYPVLGPPAMRVWLMLRGFTGFFGVFGIYYSVQYLSLSDATVITFLFPSVTALLGWLLLKEMFTKKEALAGLASFSGVVLIARPSFIFGQPSHDPSISVPGRLARVKEASYDHAEAMRMTAVGVALLGVFGAAGAFICMRRVGKNAHAMHSIAYLSAWSGFVSVIGSFVFRIKWVMPPDWKWAMGLLCIGITGFLNQTFLTLGLQRVGAGRGALGVYIQIVFALALERIVFKVHPKVLSVIGTMIILSSAIYTAVFSSPAKTPSRSEGRSDALTHAEGETAPMLSTSADEEGHVGIAGRDHVALLPLHHDPQIGVTRLSEDSMTMPTRISNDALREK